MSRQKTGKGDSGLPLPSPTSPPALDDKVLAYARRKAGDKTPARTGPLRHPWATGLATASVVAIALFISEPQQHSPALQSTPMASKDAAEKPAAAVRARVIEEYSAGTDVDMADAAPKAAKAERRQQDNTMTGLLAEQEMADSAEPPKPGEPASTLAQCAQLLREGRAEEAEILYRQLRERCQACDLPASLHTALENNVGDY